MLKVRNLLIIGVISLILSCASGVQINQSKNIVKFQGHTYLKVHVVLTWLGGQSAGRL